MRGVSHITTITTATIVYNTRLRDIVEVIIPRGSRLFV